MVRMLNQFNLDKTYQFLLIGLAFLLPLTVFGANLIIVVICLLWAERLWIGTIESLPRILGF